MIQYKNKQTNKPQPPFPFSAYVLRSYSSEPMENHSFKERTAISNQTTKET